MKSLKLVTLSLVFLLSWSNLTAQNLPVFQSGDKVCFIGNSITQDGRYHAFLQVFFATRYPNIQLEFYNCGISGDVADGMLSRLETDIMVHQPDFAFLMTGMNDIERALYENPDPDPENLAKRQAALDNYYVKTEKLVTRILERGVKLILLTPSIYDGTAQLEKRADYGSNGALGDCAQHIRRLAKKYSLPLVDFYGIMNKINRRIQKTDRTRTIVGPDRIHPGNPGHFVMANSIIQAVRPSEYVSKTIVDAKKGRALPGRNVAVEEVNVDDGLRFRSFVSSLPFPRTEATEEGMSLVPFQRRSNREILQVKKLERGPYALSIDGQEVGRYSAKALQKGVDLATNSRTPQFAQARKVYDQAFAYHQLQGRLRGIALVEYGMLAAMQGEKTMANKRVYLNSILEKKAGQPGHSWLSGVVQQYFEDFPARTTLQKEMTKLRTELYQLNQPDWHTYTLRKL